MIEWRDEKCCLDCKYAYVEENYHHGIEQRWCTKHPEWIEVEFSGHLHWCGEWKENKE